MSTKTEVKHTLQVRKTTPGPWKIGGVWAGDDDTIYSGTMALARVLKNREHVGTLIEQFEANARLIAAAPGLLLELEHELEELDGWLRDEWTQDDIKDSMLIRKRIIAAVIKKARGE